MAAATILLVVAACDPPDSISAEEAREGMCLHARAAFAVIPYPDAYAAEPSEVARVLEVDARLLRIAGDDAAAELVDQAAERLAADLASAPDLRVNLRDDATGRQVKRFAKKARKLRSVESVRFVPSEQTYEELRETDPALVETITADVLPDSFQVFVAAGADVQRVAERLQGTPGIDEVTFRGVADALPALRLLEDMCDLPL